MIGPLSPRFKLDGAHFSRNEDDKAKECQEDSNCWYDHAPQLQNRISERARSSISIFIQVFRLDVKLREMLRPLAQQLLKTTNGIFKAEDLLSLLLFVV